MANAQQPVATMMPTKRRNPFGERSMAALPSASAESAAENTQARLMSAQQNLMPLPQASGPLEYGECFVCRSYEVITSCEFCERKSCQVHTKMCHVCTGIFCSLCSITDYELRYSDAAICLSCGEEKRRGQGDAAAAANQSGSHVCGTWPPYTGQNTAAAPLYGNSGQSSTPSFQSAPFGSKRASLEARLQSQ